MFQYDTKVLLYLFSIFPFLWCPRRKGITNWWRERLKLVSTIIGFVLHQWERNKNDENSPLLIFWAKSSQGKFTLQVCVCDIVRSLFMFRSPNEIERERSRKVEWLAVKTHDRNEGQRDRTEMKKDDSLMGSSSLLSLSLASPLLFWPNHGSFTRGYERCVLPLSLCTRCRPLVNAHVVIFFSSHWSLFWCWSSFLLFFLFVDHWLTDECTEYWVYWVYEWRTKEKNLKGGHKIEYSFPLRLFLISCSPLCMILLVLLLSLLHHFPSCPFQGGTSEWSSGEKRSFAQSTKETSLIRQQVPSPWRRT